MLITQSHQHIISYIPYFCILLSIHTKFEISLYYKYTTHIFSQNFYRSIRHKYIINMPRTNRRKKIPCCDAETIKQGALAIDEFYILKVIIACIITIILINMIILINNFYLYIYICKKNSKDDWDQILFC